MLNDCVSARWSPMYQYLALTSLRDSHRLPTRHIREPGNIRRLFFSLPYFRFRTSVSVLRFPHFTCPDKLRKCLSSPPPPAIIWMTSHSANTVPWALHLYTMINGHSRELSCFLSLILEMAESKMQLDKDTCSQVSTVFSKASVFSAEAVHI